MGTQGFAFYKRYFQKKPMSDSREENSMIKSKYPEVLVSMSEEHDFGEASIKDESPKNKTQSLNNNAQCPNNKWVQITQLIPLLAVKPLVLFQIPKRTRKFTKKDKLNLLEYHTH
jgi:hypothetical protein